MAGRNEPRSSASSKLARARLRRGVSQHELADATGIPLKTYWRLEHGKTDDPSLRLLVNCALALGVELDELIEDDWRTWQVLDRRRPEPPDPAEFWQA
jgi:transcriptional regulator with XRE-family HTH domain